MRGRSAASVRGLVFQSECERRGNLRQAGACARQRRDVVANPARMRGVDIGALVGSGRTGRVDQVGSIARVMIVMRDRRVRRSATERQQCQHDQQCTNNAHPAGIVDHERHCQPRRSPCRSLRPVPARFSDHLEIDAYRQSPWPEPPRHPHFLRERRGLGAEPERWTAGRWSFRGQSRCVWGPTSPPGWLTF